MEKPLISKYSHICTNIKKHPLILAFLLNLFALIIRLLVFDVKYEVSDDFITDAVLSGAFGNGYDPDLLFGNIILGYLLVLLYKLIPTISFYFVLLLVLGFISSTSIVFLLFKKKINFVTICMSLVFVDFYTDDLFTLIQFTKVAAASGIAGGLLILYSLWEAKTHRYAYIIAGLVLMILGTMVRFSVIYIFAAFLVFVFICYCFRYIYNQNETTKKNAHLNRDGILLLLKRFLVCVLIIGILFVLEYLGSWLSNLNEGHKEFNEYSYLRYHITDVATPNFKDVEKEYEQLGLDYLDFVMLNSWSFDDRSIYSDEILQKVAEIHQSAKDNNPVYAYDVLRIMSERRVFTYPATIAIYILAIFAFVLEKRHYYSLILIIVSLSFIAGFVCWGRNVYRVEWSILFCAASCLISFFDYNEANIFSKLKTKVVGKDIRLISVIVSILTVELLVVRLPRIYMSQSYLYSSDKEYYKYFVDTMLYSGEYIPNKLSCPTVTRKPCLNLINYMKEDTEHFYYVDFGTGIQTLYFNYDPWLRPEPSVFCNDYAYFGGVTMSHPGEIYALNYNECDPYNPFKSLVNDNVLLIDGWGYEYKLEYIVRYYYPDAKIELYDIVDGYPIWNIYV